MSRTTSAETPCRSVGPARRIKWALDWGFPLLLAAALFSTLFAADGALRWIGVFGVVPLTFAEFCPNCAVRRSPAARAGTCPTWPGHSGSIVCGIAERPTSGWQ